MSVQVYFLLGQTEGERKAFLEDAKRGTTFWDYPQQHLVVIRDAKVSPFVKFEIIVLLPCFLLDLLRDMEFVDRFQDLSQVKNPAVSKAKL